MSANVSEARFATRDGLELHYRDYAPAIAVSGPPVLCLHGLTRNLRDFEELAPLLAALGRRVIVPSQRGRGGSSYDPRPERYNPAIYAADMIALLDHLNIDKAVFVGTSMGGLMTMVAALQAPARMAAAVLNDVGPEVDPAGLARIQSYAGKAMQAQAWPDAARLCRDLHAVAFPNETGDAFWLAFARRTFREAAPGRIVLDYDPNIARAGAVDPSALASLWPLYDALKPVPMLAVRGALSDVLSAQTLAEMQKRKPDLRTVTVPHVGHAPYMTEPAAWQALRAFLA